jgi:type IV pilus assembly protein PilB
MKTQETQARKDFLELLMEKSLLSHEQMEGLVAEVRGMPENEIRTVLLSKNLVSDEDLYAAWAEYLDLPYIDLRFTSFDPQALALVPPEMAREDLMIPYSYYPGEIAVAFDNPDLHIIDRLRRQTRCDILAHVAMKSRILEAIEVQYGAIDIEEASAELDLSQYSMEMLGSREVAETRPIVDISRAIIVNALKDRASDIHIEPRDDYLQIRFRVDGVLKEKCRLAREVAAPLTSRYKIMAGSDIAEKRMPQDGRIDYAIGERQIDIRASFVPAHYGEKAVLRILDKSGANLDMDRMLFSRQIYRRIKRIVSSPHGVFFVTGPTGSGKTTTLYAVINYLNSIERNIVTIEDPIEYELPLINQIQVNHTIGLDFPRILRSVLRQDPDVVLVGEIRDLETARIATEAALTGHMVLSTLHTNNAIDAVLRLVEIGVEAFMVAPSIVGIMAQRLVRRICQNCKEGYTADAEEMSYLDPSGTGSALKLHRGKGCPSCGGSGYSGRLAIHELVAVTNEIRELILQKATSDQIAKAAYKVGYRSMRFDGLKKTVRGLTTVNEILRVTTAQEDFLIE